MRKIITFLVLLIVNGAFSQQIGDGHATIISDFTQPLKSGIYNSSSAIGVSPDTSHPW